MPKQYLYLSEVFSVSRINRIMLVYLICLAVFLTGCLSPKITLWRPEDGVWFCDALRMQLSFDQNTPCYITQKENRIHCSWENDRGSVYIYIFCIEDTSQYSYGDTLFCGKCVSLTDNEYVLEDTDTGNHYAFYRTGTGDGSLS